MKPTSLPTLAATVVALAIPSAVIAQSADNAHAGHSAAATAPSNSSAMSDGEVRKVDREAKKITLRHGPITNLGMPPMTMVFQVDDATLLDQVKAGDKVKFRADKSGGAYVVKELQPAH